MNASEVAKLIRSVPFSPLRFYLSDGRSFDIAHPEMVIVDATQMIIGRPSPRIEGVAESVQFYSLLHITGAEKIQQEHA